MVVMAVIWVCLLVVGTLLRLGKLRRLVDLFWKTTPEQRERLDYLRAGKCLGSLMYSVAACLLFWPAGWLLRVDFLYFAGGGALVAVIVWFAVRMSEVERFERK